MILAFVGIGHYRGHCVSQTHLVLFRLYKANGFGKPFGPKSQVGDRIGCGIKFPKQNADQENPAAPNMAKVFFTHNGKEVNATEIVFFEI